MYDRRDYLVTCPICHKYCKYSNYLEEHLFAWHHLPVREVERIFGVGSYDSESMVTPEFSQSSNVWYRGKKYRYSPYRRQY